MKKLRKSNFLEWNNDIFISSIKKINISIILIIILDALFYILSGYFAALWLQRVQAKMAAFNVPPDIMSLGYEKASQLVSDVKEFYYLIVLSFVILLVAVIFLASILKCIIWARTTNTKITFNLISKFLGLNLVWMGFWFALLLLVSLFVEPASAPKFMLITIALGLYFTNTLYPIFIKKPGLKSIIHSVRLNIAKIHLFLLPYAVIGLVLFIIVRLASLLKFQHSTILLGMIIVVFAAVARYYISALVFEIEKAAK